jgi:hypothetical protein
MKKKGIYSNRIIVFFTVLSLMTAAIYGCATHRQTGSLAGAGVGALIGQAIGGNTAGTLIGAGIGTGVGYLIGNEKDKKAAAELQSMGQPPETGVLGGTKWKAISILPAPTPPYETYIVEFSPDGWLTTTETFADGSNKTDKEYYRVAGDTLIINNPGYIINAKYTLQGKSLNVRLDDYSAVFMRIN